MFEVDLPELEFIAADLVPRPVLLAKSDSSPVSGRIKIGRPEVRAITAQSVSDEAAQRFLRGQARHKRYTLVAFAANFYPGDDPFEKGKVTVLLQNLDAAEPPVARCLAPVRSASPVEQVTKVSVDADLKVIRLGVEHERRSEKERVFVEAAGEGCEDPEWSYRATGAHKLTGIQQMAFIAETPAGTAFTADIGLAATLRTHRFGPRDYRARVLDCAITIPPTA
jgi:hypothetical protein